MIAHDPDHAVDGVWQPKSGRRAGVSFHQHEGGAPGQNAVFWVLPETGYALVALSNTDPDAMENAVNGIVRRLPL